eukprot:5474879-Pleurochrysis_carterae.AAC.1
MHALSSKHGGHLPLRALAFASTGVVYTIATCTAASFGTLLMPLGTLILQWLRLPSQDHKGRHVCTDNCSSLRYASSLSCARADAFHRMFMAAAKLNLLSASACLAIALVHTYWIHGSRLLRLAESSNPML